MNTLPWVEDSRNDTGVNSQVQCARDFESRLHMLLVVVLEATVAILTLGRGVKTKQKGKLVRCSYKWN